jgi:hypothetical protein
MWLSCRGGGGDGCFGEGKRGDGLDGLYGLHGRDFGGWELGLERDELGCEAFDVAFVFFVFAGVHAAVEVVFFVDGLVDVVLEEFEVFGCGLEGVGEFFEVGDFGDEGVF